MRRSLYLLNIRQLFSLRLRVIIAIISVAAGSSLALSVVIVSSSVSTSLNRFDNQVAGPAPIRVSGASSSGGVDFTALAAVLRTPGVRDAVPVVQAISTLKDRTGTRNVVVLGVDCGVNAGSDAFCALAPGTKLNPARLLVVPSTLARHLNHASILETDVGALPLASATGDSALNGLNRGNVVVMSLGAAQRDFDRLGQVDDVYVSPAPGVSTSALQARLARAVGEWDGVSLSAAIPPEIQLLINEFVPILSLLAILAAGIAIVLVYNVVTLSLEERRRSQAIAAVVGAPPAVLLLGPLLEAATLGAVGGALGALGGVVLAGPIVNSLSTSTVQLVGVPLSVHASASTYLIGLVLGAVLSVIASVRPVRRALRRDAAAELSNRDQREEISARHSLRNALSLTVVAGGGLVLCWLGERHGSLESWQPVATIAGFAIGTIGFAIASGAWAPLVLRLFARQRPFRSGVAQLGIANLLRVPARTAVMAVAIGSAAGIAFVTASYSHAVDKDIAGGIQQSSFAHGVVVTTLSGKSGNNTDARIPQADIAALSAVPGVTEVQQLQGLVVGHNSSQLTLVLTSTPPFSNLAVFEGTASPAGFDRGEALVGANLARRDHVHPGSLLTIDTPSGFRRVGVEGVWDNGNAGGENITIDPTVYRRLFGRQLPNELNLEVAADVPVNRVATAAAALHLDPFLVFQTPTKQLSSEVSSISGQLTPFWVLQRALLLVTFVSVLSTLLLVGVQRRREFGLLAAVGLSPRELFEMVVTEALTVGIVGAILGVAFSFLMLEGLLDALPLFVGFHDSYSPDFGAIALYAPIAIAIAVLASLWPGWRAARLPILEALQYE